MSQEKDPVDVEFTVQEVGKPTKLERRGGRRPGAGRPSLVRENKARMEMGLEPLKPNKRIVKKTPKSKAILPESKKARAQMVLAEMLGRKGKYIVQKVLDKALDDNDEDQMACLKLVMDRVLPADYMSKMKGGSGGVTIQIMGVGETVIAGSSDEEDDSIDAEFEEVTEDGEES